MQDGSFDKGMEVAMEAWKLAEKGEANAWIPQHSRIFAHSKMVSAKQNEEFIVKVPEEPGIYPYVCTFPGHAMAMNGELKVVSEGNGFSVLNFQLYLGKWDRLPDFSALKPHRQGPLAGKKLDLKLEGMSEHFGVRFDGKLEAPEDGPYRFMLASDDGARLYINGREVIDNDGTHPSNNLKETQVQLTKGTNLLLVDYFDHTALEEVYLAWAGPKFDETALSKWIHPSRQEGEEEESKQMTGIPLVPENGEALIHRNFIEGSSPRAIAVGYPNGVNVCFDADQMSQVLMWRGAFIDAKQHWTDRGGGNIEPLGFGVVQLHDGPGMAVLADENAPWPKVRKRTPQSTEGKEGKEQLEPAEGIDRAAGIRFLGHRLDGKRFPTFQYRMGRLTVEEHYEPKGDYKTTDEQFTRVLRFSGEPPAGLFLRVATGLTADSGSFKHKDGAVFAVSGGEALLRNNSELLVLPAFAGGASEVRISVAWSKPL